MLPEHIVLAVKWYILNQKMSFNVDCDILQDKEYEKTFFCVKFNLNDRQPSFKKYYLEHKQRQTLEII